MTPAEEKDAMKKAHAILRAALREVAFEDRPALPWHAGGPFLTCPAVGQVGISLWCAALLNDRAAPGEKKELARIKRLVDEFLAAPRMIQSAKDPEVKLREKLVEAGTALKSDSAPMTCMRRAASGAATYLRGKPDLVFSSASAAVLRTVKEFAVRPQPMRVKEFLTELDHRLMREELTGAHKERIKKAPPPIARVLFRSADAKGKMSCFVARLESGHYGVLVRLQGKAVHECEAGTADEAQRSLLKAERPRKWTWGWVEGMRDDVLATVPDELFKAATQRVLESEGS